MKNIKKSLKPTESSPSLKFKALQLGGLLQALNHYDLLREMRRRFYGCSADFKPKKV